MATRWTFRSGYTKSPYVPDAYKDVTRYAPPGTLSAIKTSLTPHGRANDTPPGFKPYTLTPRGEKVYSGDGYVAVEAANRKDIMGIGGEDYNLYMNPTPAAGTGTSNEAGTWGYLANGKWGKIPWWGRRPDSPVTPTWSATYTVPNAPKWWKGMTYSGQDPTANYAMMLNALIPTLSPEDQRTMASYLYQTFEKTAPAAFGDYNPEVAKYGDVPKLNTEMQERFTSKKRAEEALRALDKMIAGGGKTKESMGEGYTYLRRLLSTMGQFSGENAENKQTREQVVQQLGALSPLLSEAKGALAPYASIAQALTTPFFSSGKVIPISKDAKGNYIFGEQNKRLY